MRAAALALTLALTGCASAARAPRAAKAYGELGLARLALDEDYAGAVKDLSRAIALDPEDPGLFVLRGMAYAGQGAKERADADFKKAGALDSGLKKALAPLMR
ncbi:MAG: tetratricopeptide repeat protein [Elusimicrobia bacterium]|nr:tetratricopeptide repeat protein [Elusimicrobiota bacterium]